MPGAHLKERAEVLWLPGQQFVLVLEHGVAKRLLIEDDAAGGVDQAGHHLHEFNVDEGAAGIHGDALGGA